MSSPSRWLLSILSIFVAVVACADSAPPTGLRPTDTGPAEIIRLRSAAEEQATFHFAEPGYHCELVVGDDAVYEPVLAVFDGNGRMYVAEMKSYMQDIDGRNEETPVSQVSVHWSSRGDGVFDRHTVFADKLLLPRMVLPLDDGRVIIGESDTSDLWIYTDTNGDGVSDRKEIFYAGGPRGGNIEHQPSGLIWSLDNWLYTTYNAYRLRYTRNGAVREPTYPNGGQWGLTQDDYGKPWWVDAGGEKGPWNFQVPNLYAEYNLPDDEQYAPDFRTVWPLVGLADVQGGPIRFRPDDKTLNHFTATCGATIFRGDRLPADLRGDLLFAEPVGRLIRRAKIEVKDGQTRLRNAYDHTEFLRSTDPNFRPVNLTTGPDGCLYLVDMYRGIIQEGTWVRPGSYLRGVVEQYGFDKNIGHGRIWRIVHDGYQPGSWPKFQNSPSAQLVPLLENPNGWWRDTAQKLIVLHGDHSVVPALEKMARSDSFSLARIHALWTLEGLSAVSPALLLEKFQDADPHVRAAAIRVSESLYPDADQALVTAVEKLAQDPDPGVAEQSLMTLKRLKIPGWENLTQLTIARTKSVGVRALAEHLLHKEESLGGPQFTKAEAASLHHGQAIYRELCFSCHGADGRGMPLEGAPAGSTIAPPLAGAKDLLGAQDAAVYILLHGLSGPIEDRQYQAQMVSMASNDDQWIADVISYVRNAFGNHASLVTAAEVSRLRRNTAGRTAPWTLEELRAVLPQPLTNAASWRLTASLNAEHVRLAADGNLATRWDTGVTQIPGMWFQIELPAAATVCGLVLDAGTSTGDYPRGYRVELSNDGQHWGQPVATGKGVSAVTEIQFPPQAAKFIRITQTGKVAGLYWSIHELRIDTPGAKPQLTKLAAGQKSEFE